MIEPLGFYVLIEVEQIENKTAGGIFLPDETVDREKRGNMRGTILAVGPAAGSLNSGHVGKVAYFGRYAGMLIEEDGKQLRLIDAQEIRGVV